MLVDERTVGEGEHTGLFLEAANKTEFIGTPSAGADSEATLSAQIRRAHHCEFWDSISPGPGGGHGHDDDD